MREEWRGTDQEPEGQKNMKGDETLDIWSHLLTVLPPHGEDAHEEGERCHDNLTTSLSTTFSRKLTFSVV